MVTGTEFKRMICDSGPASENPESVKKVIFCTGKVFYDLVKARRDAGLEDKIAICTLEQISPFPYDLVQEECGKYSNAELIFCQVLSCPVFAYLWPSAVFTKRVSRLFATDNCS